MLNKPRSHDKTRKQKYKHTMATFTFTRGDLTYKDYLWSTTEGDSPRVLGFPDNVLLNRKEGYEVVHFIDKFIKGEVSWEQESAESKKRLGNKLERLIHDKLPGDVRSHLRVRSWIAANWNVQH